MKKSAVFITAMVLTASLAFGLLPASAAVTSASASVDLLSSYVWRGFQIHEGEAIQPSVGITYGGFGANLWSDHDTEKGEAVETDLTLNYSFTRDKFSFDVGYIYYALDGADDTQEIYLTVGYDTLLSPALAIYYDFDEGDGAFITASIGHDVTLQNDMSLSLGALVSYNAESDYSIGNYSDFHNAEVSATLGMTLIKNVSISPKIAYTFDLSDDAETAIEGLSADGDDSSFLYGGVNVTLSF